MFCCKKADLRFCPCRKDMGSVILLWIKETEKSSRGENMELFEFYKKIEEKLPDLAILDIMKGKTVAADISFRRENSSQRTVTVRSRMNN